MASPPPLQDVIDAAWRGDTVALEFLCPLIPDINAALVPGRPALYMAAYNSRAAATRYLLSQGARIDVREVNGDTILHAVAACGSLECLELLMDAAPAFIDQPNGYGTTPVMRASDPVKIEAFARRGANLDRRNDVGGSMLSWALEEVKEPLVAYLSDKVTVWDEACEYHLKRYQKELAGSLYPERRARILDVLAITDHIKTRIVRDTLDEGLPEAGGPLPARPRL